ncbi:MAG: hypothetical protein HYZ88_00940, partial [Candidatus Omnitrophica bacterium]|nr:hypothetical protein [Candidatus Omnitrophota bacterium]
MRSHPVLAIDLGSSKVACLVEHDGEILNTGLANYPMETAAGFCEPSLIARTIELALDDARLSQLPGRALVALTHPAFSHTTVSTQIAVADEPATIRSRELQRLHAQAVGQALALDQDVLLLEALGYTGNGFEGVKNPRGLVATRMNGTFQLIAMPLATQRAATQALDIVGLEVDRFVYGLKAAAASCLSSGTTSREAKCLVIDIGGRCTDAAIVDQGSLVRTRSMAWGGLTIAEAVAQQCRLTLEQALTASLEGLTSPKPEIRQAVEHQLSVLHQHIQPLVNGQPLPRSAIVTGRGALMDGVVEW